MAGHDLLLLNKDRIFRRFSIEYRRVGEWVQRGKKPKKKKEIKKGYN